MSVIIPTDRRFMDMTGQRYGRLAVIAYAGRPKPSKHVWLCKCDCGNDPIIDGQAMRQGKAKSCGCLRSEMSAARRATHMATDTREYVSWEAMRARCLNTRHHKYPNYGGRGITICDRWNDFASFFADMGPRPLGTSLDRYPNNDGNYEPSNCRWATDLEQQRNRRPRRGRNHS